MKVFIVISIIIVSVVFVGKKFLQSAKRNLFKDEPAWSGKDIKIKYTNSKNVSDTKTNINYLKMIADESKIYLEDQSKNEEK